MGGTSSYFRRRRVRLSARFRLRPELSLLSRFAFFATCCRYRWTISPPEAPAMRLVLASNAAFIFSLTISSASRRARLPPRISFIIRSATTPFASTANIIKELTIHIAALQKKRKWSPDSSLINSARNKAYSLRINPPHPTRRKSYEEDCHLHLPEENGPPKRTVSLTVNEHRCYIADALSELRQARRAYWPDRMFSSLTSATPRYGPAG